MVFDMMLNNTFHYECDENIASFMLGVRLKYVGIRSSVHLTTSLHFKGDLNTQMGGHALCADQTYHSCSLNFEFSSRENLMPVLVFLVGLRFCVQILDTATL